MQPRDKPSVNRIERKKRETRQKIITKALALFQQQGFTNTTMEQIAEEADIARKTLYNHFPVKEAIVEQYVRDMSSDLARETMHNVRNLTDTRSRLLFAINKAYEWVEHNPELTSICLNYRMKNMYQKGCDEYGETGTRSIISEVIRLGQESGEIRRDFPVKLLAMQIDVLRGAVVMDWLNDMSGFELRREIARVVELFLDGAINRK